MTCCGVHAQLDDLERDATADRLFLFGHVNRAAAAFADFLQQLVGTNAVAGLLFRGEIARRGDAGSRRVGSGRRVRHGLSERDFSFGKKILGVDSDRQQFFDAGPQGVIAGASAVKERLAFRGVFQLARGVKHRFFLFDRGLHRSGVHFNHAPKDFRIRQ